LPSLTLKKSSVIVFLKQLALFVILFIVLSNFQLDQDLLWHIALGNHMLATGEVMRGDVFTWTMPGYVWGNSYVFYEIFVAWFLQYVGYIQMVFLFGLAGALTFSALVKRISLIQAILVLLAASLSRANLGVRPHMFSFIFFSMLLLALERKLFDRPIFSLIAFVGFAFWANIHRGFVFALVFFGAYLFLSWLSGKKINRWSTVAFFCAIVGTFVTPHPLEIWTGGVADDFKTWENLWYIAEWFPTALFYPINILFAGSGVVLAYMFAFGGRKINPVWFMCATLTFALAFLFVNLVSFWTAIFVFLTSRYFEVSSVVLKRYESRGWIFIGVVSALCVFGLIFNFALGKTEKWSLDAGLSGAEFPTAALDYIKKQKIDGNIFNEYQWGGYLIWQGEERVFIDGRMAGWKREGVSILGDYVKVMKGECEVLDKYDARIILVRPSFNIECFGSYKEVWRDDTALILLKS